MALTTYALTRVRPYVDEASLERLGGHAIHWDLVTDVDAASTKYLKAGTVVGKTSAGLLVPRKATVAISALAVVGTTATATSTAHGLAVGDRITLSGATPSWLNGSYTVATVADANTFTVTLTTPVSTAEARLATLTDTGDVVTLNGHGFINGDLVEFDDIVTTTGLTRGTNYFVIGATTNTFQVSATAGGSAVALTTDGSALVRAVTGGTYTAGGTIVFAYAAKGILETDATKDSLSSGYSGYSLVVGGVLYENLLPDASGSPKVIPTAYKTELTAAGCTFKLATYADNRT